MTVVSRNVFKLNSLLLVHNSITHYTYRYMSGYGKVLAWESVIFGNLEDVPSTASSISCLNMLQVECVLYMFQCGRCSQSECIL